nr:hypothetical protein [Tanacetum cinerariifolium]
DLFYLKHGNSRPKKHILSLHKYPVVPFLNDDIDERTSRWVSKRLRRFNVYAQYGFKHWKNTWTKQDHIIRHKQLRDNPHEVYSEAKIIEIIRKTYELGHEHKFITKIIVRRANGEIDPITEPDYKYLNKNDIEDMYLLYINDKVKDYRETRLLGSLVVFIRATVIWERVHDFQLGIEIVSMIYKNNKKEKRVTMIHKEIHKFSDATLKRVLEGLEKHNKDAKYGYADPSHSDADAKYLRYYEKDIEDRLKHQDQIRR